MIRTKAAPSALILAMLCGCLNAIAADNTIGWRGDGTGKYPGTHPPVTWSRTSTAVKALRFSAENPGGADSGTAMSDGVIREWLVVGPLALKQDEPEATALPDE